MDLLLSLGVETSSPLVGTPSPRPKQIIPIIPITPFFPHGFQFWRRREIIKLDLSFGWSCCLEKELPFSIWKSQCANHTNPQRPFQKVIKRQHFVISFVQFQGTRLEPLLVQKSYHLIPWTIPTLQRESCNLLRDIHGQPQNMSVEDPAWP